MENFQGICLGHACSKTYQYATVEKEKSLGVWNMFSLNLPKQICKNVLHGLKS